MSPTHQALVGASADLASAVWKVVTTARVKVGTSTNPGSTKSL